VFVSQRKRGSMHSHTQSNDLFGHSQEEPIAPSPRGEREHESIAEESDLEI